jgi:hypothetical protein
MSVPSVTFVHCGYGMYCLSSLFPLPSINLYKQEVYIDSVCTDM